MSNPLTNSVHKPLLGNPLKIDQLAAYQTGSIVSTRLIHKSTGNITVFAFDEGQELSEHKAPFDALVTIFDGDARIMVGTNWHNLTQGDAMILPANIPHAVKATTQFKMMLTMIRS